MPDALDIPGQLSSRGARFALGASAHGWNCPLTRMFLQILAVIAEFGPASWILLSAAAG